MKKKYVIILVTLLFLLVWGIVQLRNYFGPKGISIDKSIYPVTGIDISKHTGVIDWQKIKKQKISFVYIKATEGQDYIDPNYYINLTHALKANLKVGEYHFFRFNKTGEAQAQNFLSHALHDPGKLPPVLDVEEWGNLPNYKSNKEIRAEIRKYILIVESTLNCRIIIYTNMDSYNRFIKGEFLKNPIWICTFSKKPKLPDGRNWLFWQHAHNGKVDGINGNADINTFNGDETSWNRYISALK